MLIDAVQSGARIAQVGIGRVEHDSQRLEAPGDMARQVSRAILTRASRYGRLSAQQVEEVEEIERSSQIELSSLLARVEGATNLAIFDMGIISDSYFVAAEIIRRRVFADFSIAHLMRFRDGVATGRITVSSAMKHPFGCREHVVCKHNAVLHLGQQLQIPPDRMLAVGDGLPDRCMFAAAGVSFAFEPKSDDVAKAADFVIHENLLKIEDFPGVRD
ncbi:MAG: HAD hydrolase family protein [Planctomycetota bacterium]